MKKINFICIDWNTSKDRANVFSIYIYKQAFIRSENIDFALLHAVLGFSFKAHSQQCDALTQCAMLFLLRFLTRTYLGTIIACYVKIYRLPFLVRRSQKYMTRSTVFFSFANIYERFVKTRFENINNVKCETSLHFLTMVECSTSDQQVPGSSIARGIVLCPSERHFINTGPEVIKPLFMLNSFDHEICRYKRMRQSSSEKKIMFIQVEQ